MNGIIIVNKPKNYTSFDVIAVLRKKLSQKKIGHMGTLDPMATGVLPVLLGSTAKFQTFVSCNDKEYVAEIHFGIITDTWDIFGKLLSSAPSCVTKSDLENVLEKFTGEINQIPPMYSAIKKNGIKLCDLARQGKEIERDARRVTIKSISITDFNSKLQTSKIKVLCSKGTYIRSLCFDIGKALGCGASMGNLCRTLSNSFTIDDSISLETLKDLSIEEIKNKYVYPTERLFQNNNSINLSPYQIHLFKNGVSISNINLDTGFVNDEILKVYGNNEFLGIGKVDSGTLKFLKLETKE